ncbi:MAG: prepilin-type N-terminal cleavage/methylation domain-containing protein [Pseudomonadota bacterium]
MKTHGLQGARRQRAGFTLVEMIGVMAIIAILASAIAPSAIRLIIRARGDQETNTVKALAEELQQYVHRQKQIPAPSVAAWSAAIASLSDLPVDQIATNPGGYDRAVYFDPRFFTNTDTSFGGYTQTGGLNSAPVSPRFMVVSNLEGNVPAAPVTHAAFSAIWEQTSAAGLVESESIKIERRNLGGLFRRVLLSNERNSEPSFQLEGGGRVALATAPVGGPATVSERYIISDSRVSLYDAPFATAALEQVTLIDSDKHYRYRQDGADWVWELP